MKVTEKEISILAEKHGFPNSEIKKLNFNLPWYQLNLCVEDLNLKTFKLFNKLEKSGFKIIQVAKMYSTKKYDNGRIKRNILGIGFDIMIKGDYKKIEQGHIKFLLKKWEKK